MGKYLEMVINTATTEEASKTTQEACKKLLANPVMEDFTYTIEEIKDRNSTP
jgi:phosphoribosylformylglycinamidine synthase